jgi:hypothetical protein
VEAETSADCLIQPTPSTVEKSTTFRRSIPESRDTHACSRQGVAVKDFGVALHTAALSRISVVQEPSRLTHVHAKLPCELTHWQKKNSRGLLHLRGKSGRIREILPFETFSWLFA